jgi:type II secretory pathway pseudopilin PulG
MICSRKFRRGPNHREQGYILLILLLFVAMLGIAAMSMAPPMIFQMKRDREEEMIHRGAQYARAIRTYVKKFGRYPTRLEELDNTNNVRFLRKHYKDPITGKEFKVLHMNDVQSMMMQGAAAAGMALNNAGGTGFNAATGGAAAGVAAVAGAAMASGFGAPNSQPNLNASGDQQQQQGQGEDTNNVPATPVSSLTSNALGSQVFGGGPIVGVASTSKDKTIREFSKKNHYDQWQFIYDPSSDRGGLINGPAQPLITQQGIPGASMPGQPVNGLQQQQSPPGMQQLQPQQQQQQQQPNPPDQ